MKLSAPAKNTSGSALITILLIIVSAFLIFVLAMAFTQGTSNEFGPEDVMTFLYDARDFMLGGGVDDVDSDQLHPEFFKGSIQVLNADGQKVQVRLTASSTQGSISHMKVWSSDRAPREWSKYSKTSIVDLKDFVYARFKDENGNISDKYTLNTHTYKN